MGKSPGKWIKTVLFGKKASKSTFSKGREARRAFWALKGIIRLQALVRGRLVRRQAVSTLYCVFGIVKLQAVVRGRKVRHSETGAEVRKYVLMNTPDDVLGDHSGVSKSTCTANAFVKKLLSSSPIVMPLHLNYESGDPNSVLSWIERWSLSHVWKPIPRPKKTMNSKSQRKQGGSQLVDAETGRPKRSVRRIVAMNVDNISEQSVSEIEKPRHNLQRASSHHAADSMQENPLNELEKVKRNLRKVHNPVTEGPVHPYVEIEKPRLSLGKGSTPFSKDALEHSMSDSAQNMNEITETQSILPDVETSPGALVVNVAIDLLHDDQAVTPLQPLDSGRKDEKDENISVANGGLDTKESTSKENQKSSKKVSRQELGENGLQSSPTLPSYMAATESAKAKLRGQGSPRLGADGTEKNTTRRHSLPSTTNGKVSSLSPRTRKLVQASGKGGNRSERFPLSSRDSNGKAIQAEWRR
ncbi:protein IQ-DOMAIN 31-like isoform X2 [Malania oleifera]|uniref:protein IQ-DOMAIN 31-like isoform X2 n=1 Tax=Malania oleifera TaxID=397392 RepID=UPI0025AE1EB5|nr:protein IQ-DOMAIN 31-like isoform X2 [Malania oleifera]